MFDLVQEIAQVDAVTLENLLIAIRQRHAVLFPDRDLITISLLKNADPKSQLDRMIELLQNLKTAL